jgi:hypothetical protein
VGDEVYVKSITEKFEGLGLLEAEMKMVDHTTSALRYCQFNIQGVSRL